MFRGALGALLLCPGVMIAQRVQSSFDVGAVSLRYADSVSVSAAIFTPDIRFEAERAVAQAAATFSQFRGGWSAQGTTSGSLFSATRRGLLGELAGVAGGSTHQDGTRTGQVIANVRLHAPRPRAGAFAGAGAGGTWDGSVWRRLLMGELGAWVQTGPATALATITPVAVDDSVRYLDSQLALSRTSSPVDLTFLVGARAGSQIPGVETQTRAWGSLTAVAWVAPRVAVVGSGGTYPVDPTQGFPGGRFVSVTVRLLTSGAAPGRGSPAPAVAIEPMAAEPAGVEAFELDRTSPGNVAIIVRAPTAASVEITGDFSGWNPVKLQLEANGTWAGSFSLTPGQYQMNLRVDGGPWLVPPGLLSLKDEFGGSVGLLVIE